MSEFKEASLWKAGGLGTALSGLGFPHCPGWVPGMGGPVRRGEGLLI